MSERANRANVNVVFADEDSAFRSGLRDALVREGYESVEDCRTLGQVEAAFAAGLPDLLVIDARMEGGKSFDLIGRVRRGELGRNPFVVIMVTLWQPDGALVHRVIESGADDLLLKPVSTAVLIDRIRKLARERQRFVVTTDYIGPQRRKSRTKDDTEAGLKLDLIEVPNTLGAKSRGEAIDDDALQAMIAAAQVEINEQRLKRNAPAIAALVREIVPAWQEGRDDAVTRRRVEALANLAEDVSARLHGTRFVHVSDLCDALGGIAGAVRGGAPDARSVALLTPLSDAIGASFNPEEKSAAFAEQVVALMRDHLDRRGAVPPG